MADTDLNAVVTAAPSDMPELDSFQIEQPRPSPPMQPTELDAFQIPGKASLPTSELDAFDAGGKAASTSELDAFNPGAGATSSTELDAFDPSTEARPPLAIRPPAGFKPVMKPGQQPESSFAGATGRAAAASALPTAGAVAGGIAGGKMGAIAGTAVGGPVGGVVGGLIGGIGGAILAGSATAKAQDYGINALMGEDRAEAINAQLAKDRAERPVASFIGEVIPQAIAFRPSLKNLKQARDFSKLIMKGGEEARAILATPAGKAQVGNLINVGLGAGTQAGQEAYRQYQEGDFNGVRLAGSLVAGAILTENRSFRYRAPPLTREAARGHIESMGFARSQIRELDNGFVVTSAGGKSFRVEYRQQTNPANMTPSEQKAFIESARREHAADVQAIETANKGDSARTVQDLVGAGFERAGDAQAEDFQIRAPDGTVIRSRALVTLVEGRATKGVLSHEVNHAIEELAGVTQADSAALDASLGVSGKSATARAEARAKAVERAVDSPYVRKVLSFARRALDPFLGPSERATGRARLDAIRRLESGPRATPEQAMKQIGGFTGTFAGPSGEPIITPPPRTVRGLLPGGGNTGTPSRAPLAMDQLRGMSRGDLNDIADTFGVAKTGKNGDVIARILAAQQPADAVTGPMRTTEPAQPPRTLTIGDLTAQPPPDISGSPVEMLSRPAVLTKTARDLAAKQAAERVAAFEARRAADQIAKQRRPVGERPPPAFIKSLADIPDIPGLPTEQTAAPPSGTPPTPPTRPMTGGAAPYPETSAPMSGAEYDASMAAFTKERNRMMDRMSPSKMLVRRSGVERNIRSRWPVDADSLDMVNETLRDLGRPELVLPQGYARSGDRYVFNGENSVAAENPAPSPEIRTPLELAKAGASRPIAPSTIKKVTYPKLKDLAKNTKYASGQSVWDYARTKSRSGLMAAFTDHRFWYKSETGEINRPDPWPPERRLAQRERMRALRRRLDDRAEVEYMQGRDEQRREYVDRKIADGTALPDGTPVFDEDGRDWTIISVEATGSAIAPDGVRYVISDGTTRKIAFPDEIYRATDAVEESALEFFGDIPDAKPTGTAETTSRIQAAQGATDGERAVGPGRGGLGSQDPQFSETRTVENPYTGQREIGIENEPFRLVGEEGLTPSEMARQRAERVAAERARVDAEERQQKLFSVTRDPSIANRFRKRSTVFGKDATETYTDTLIRNVQDYTIRLKRVQEMIKRGGRAIPDRQDVFQKADAYQSVAGARVNEFRKSDIEPVTTLMSKEGVALKDLDTYLYANHALLHRNDVIAKRHKGDPAFADGGSGMTKAQARAEIARLQSEGKLNSIKRAADMYYALGDKHRAQLVADGLITQKQADDWVATFGRDYVPLRKESVDLFAPGTGQGYSIGGRESMVATGRQVGDLADSPFIYGIQQMETALIRAEKNRVAQTFHALVTANPDPNLWEIKPRRRIWAPDLKKGQAYQIDDPSYYSDPNVVHGKINGQEFFIEVKDELTARAMKNLGAESGGKLVETIGSLTRLYAGLITRWNPEFVFPNFIRDVQSAVTTMGADLGPGFAASIARQVPVALKSALSYYHGGKPTGKYNEALFKDFQANGGQIEFLGLKTVEQRTKELERVLRVKSGGAPVRAAWEALAGRIEATNTAVENATRIAVYQAALEARLPGGAVRFTKAQAAEMARNATVNFTKRGELSNILNTVYLFFNASVQGSARLLRSMMTKRGAAVASSVSALAYIMDQQNRLVAGDSNNDGKNDYDAIPEYEKRANFIVMKDDGTYIKIPLPYGYNVLHAFGRSLSAAQEGTITPQQAAVATASSMAGAFNPLGQESDGIQQLSPTVLDPFVQAMSNRNWMGQPIRPEQYPGQPAKPYSEMSMKSTADWARAAARTMNEATGGDPVTPGWIDVSPGMIQHWVDFTLAGAGKFYTRGAEFAKNLVTGTDTDQRNIPFARRFVGKRTEYQTAGEFKANRKAVEDLVTRLNYYRANGMAEQAEQLRAAEGKKLALASAFRETNNRVTLIRKRIETIRNPTEKARLEGVVENLMITANRRFNQSLSQT